MTPKLEFLVYPHFFLRNLISTAQLELQPSAKKAPKPTQVCFQICSSAPAAVIQLWTPICQKEFYFSARLVF